MLTVESVANLVVDDRYSECIRSIVVNPLLGTACVAYKDSDVVYKYSDVPSTEIFRLIHHKDISLGMWVNQVLKNTDLPFLRETFGY